MRSSWIIADKEDSEFGEICCGADHSRCTEDDFRTVCELCARRHGWLPWNTEGGTGC